MSPMLENNILEEPSFSVRENDAISCARLIRFAANHVVTVEDMEAQQKRLQEAESIFVPEVGNAWYNREYTM